MSTHRLPPLGLKPCVVSRLGVSMKSSPEPVERAVSNYVAIRPAPIPREMLEPT